ncbi:MAG: SoxR reducing system RseC family protein [Thiohalomonadales bacterium]
MIEEIAKVESIDVKAGTLTVEVQRQSVCGGCSARGGCGSAVISKVLGRRRSILSVKFVQNDVAVGDIVAGDRVVLGLPERALISGSVAVYAVPLIFMISFAILGEFVGRQLTIWDVDTVSALFALLGIIIGIVWLRHFARSIKDNERYQPSVLRVLPQSRVSTHSALRVI